VERASAARRGVDHEERRVAVPRRSARRSRIAVVRALALPPPPWIVAHRGVSAEMLENTLEALSRAVAQRSPMAEVDVQLARDGVPVVFHDWDLRRLGGGDVRVVEETDSTDLARVALSLAIQRGGPTAAQAVLHGALPTLAGLLAVVPPAFALNLELKRRDADRDRFVAALAATLDERTNLLVSSFDHELLARLRAVLPDLPLAPLAGHDGAVLLAAGRALDAFSLHAHTRLASAELVAAARADGRPLLVYTVNEAVAARRLLDLGVSGLFSDRPRRLADELGLPAC
jgi:glycerophosphoryl diester phosphodiesterase